MVFPVAEYSAWVKAPAQANAPRSLASSAVHAVHGEELPALGLSLEGLDLAWGPHGSDGAGPLRERIAALRGVHEDRVVVASGTTGANFLVLAANLEDRGASPAALVERPGFTPLEQTLEALGYRVVPFERPDGVLDPDRVDHAWTADTAVVVVTSTHNPTGLPIERPALAALADLCERRRALLLSDEVYRELLPPEAAPPAHALSQAACSTESLSKVHGLAELRIGWAIGSPGLVERARRVSDQVTGELPTIARHLGARALDRWDALVARGRAVAASQRPVVERLVREHGLSWSAPPGGVHALVETHDPDIARRARDEEGLLLASGDFFHASASAVRIGWGGSKAAFADAIAAFGRVLHRRRAA